MQTSEQSKHRGIGTSLGFGQSVCLSLYVRLVNLCLVHDRKRLMWVWRRPRHFHWCQNQENKVLAGIWKVVDRYPRKTTWKLLMILHKIASEAEIKKDGKLDTQEFVCLGFFCTRHLISYFYQWLPIVGAYLYLARRKGCIYGCIKPACIQWCYLLKLVLGGRFVYSNFYITEWWCGFSGHGNRIISRYVLSLCYIFRSCW